MFFGNIYDNGYLYWFITEADKGQSQNIYEIRKNVFKIRKKYFKS